MFTPTIKENTKKLGKKRTSILHTFIKVQTEMDELIKEEEAHSAEIQAQIDSLLSEKKDINKSTKANKRILEKLDDFLNVEDEENDELIDAIESSVAQEVA